MLEMPCTGKYFSETKSPFSQKNSNAGPPWSKMFSRVSWEKPRMETAQTSPSRNSLFHRFWLGSTNAKVKLQKEIHFFLYCRFAKFTANTYYGFAAGLRYIKFE